MMNNITQQHCINVLKVFDWISKQTDINLSKSLECQEFVTDKVCGNISLQSGENSLLWNVNGKLLVSGDVTVIHEMGCQNIKVIINKKYERILSKGEECTINFHNLKSLEVICNGNTDGYFVGQYCLNIHYKLNDGCFNSGDYQLKCFLSDECGNPVESLICQENLPIPNRRNIEVITPKGETIILQKVQVLLKGFVTIEVLNQGKLCKVCTIPFQVIDEFILCAPMGTILNCKVTNFDCISYFTDDCRRINVAVSFCQQVQIVANTTIEIEAKPCHPRVT